MRLRESGNIVVFGLEGRAILKKPIVPTARGQFEVWPCAGAKAGPSGKKAPIILLDVVDAGRYEEGMLKHLSIISETLAFLP
jgi:hypothetical protein